jgi:hypothetical protein
LLCMVKIPLGIGDKISWMFSQLENTVHD